MSEPPPPTRMGDQSNALASKLNICSTDMRSSPLQPNLGSHPPFLPPEIVTQIISFLPRGRPSQAVFYACALVSRVWHTIAIPRLYEAPWIRSTNFAKFIDTVCPSINSHIKTSEFSSHIKILDMSNLVHDGSKSLTARLIGRVKENVEVLIAPQTSFAYVHPKFMPPMRSLIPNHSFQGSVNSLAALSKCRNLRYLDLSYICGSLNLVDFFKAISKLSRLECLRFPRTSFFDQTVPSVVWPPGLTEIYLSGQHRQGLLPCFSTLPPTLTSLSLSNCRLDSNLYTSFIHPLVQLLGPKLRTLRIFNLLTSLDDTRLDNILRLLPVIRSLSVSVELITKAFFECASDLKSTYPSPLVELELSSMKRRINDAEPHIKSDMIWSTVVDGGLGNLRRLRVHRNLGWGNIDAQQTNDVNALSLILQARAKQDGEQAVVKECDAGVWNYGQ